MRKGAPALRVLRSPVMINETKFEKATLFSGEQVFLETKVKDRENGK